MQTFVPNVLFVLSLQRVYVHVESNCVGRNKPYENILQNFGKHSKTLQFAFHPHVTAHQKPVTYRRPTGGCSFVF